MLIFFNYKKQQKFSKIKLFFFVLCKKDVFLLFLNM